MLYKATNTGHSYAHDDKHWFSLGTVVRLVTVPSEKKKPVLINIIQCKSWLSDNLPRLTE